MLYHRHPFLEEAGHVVHFFPSVARGRYCQVCGEALVSVQCAWANEFNDKICGPCANTRIAPFLHRWSVLEWDGSMYTNEPCCGCIGPGGCLCR